MVEAIISAFKGELAATTVNAPAAVVEKIC
jgi:hypothetical protein